MVNTLNTNTSLIDLKLPVSAYLWTKLVPRFLKMNTLKIRTLQLVASSENSESLL